MALILWHTLQRVLDDVSLHQVVGGEMIHTYRAIL